jgi:hypothetical protein
MKILTLYYPPIVPLYSPRGAAPSTRTDESVYCSALNGHLAAYTELCRSNKYINYGLLPWKLFDVNYNYIEKEDNYLAPWMSKIAEVVEFVKTCNEPASAPLKLTMFNSFIKKFDGSGFSDE